MIAECAVEPDVMARWEHFEKLYADFGVGHGRLLCEFPKKWRKLVLQRASELEAAGINSPRQAALLVDEFQHGGFLRGLVASEREYPAYLDWCDAAKSVVPKFDLIVQSSPPTSDNELLAGEILRLRAPFARKRQDEVRRKAANLIACGWSCYRRAKEIYLVDPYFRPSDANFGRVLGHLLTRLEREAVQPKRLEVHTSLPNVYRQQTQKGNWDHWATEHLPSGWTLKVFHWEKLETGGKLHARYILTDFGGVDYNWGTDEDPDEHTQVTLLDDSFWETLYNRFALPDGRIPQVFSSSPDRIFQVIG